MKTIYKKSAIWCEGNFSRDEVQQNLFWNFRPGPWFTNSSDRNSIINLSYMTILPYNKIHNLAVESYEKAGFKSITGLSSNSKLTVDWMNHNYSLVYNGKEIAGHNATYCPLNSNRIAFYSRNVQRLMTALPAGLKAGKVVAHALLIDHLKKVPILIEDGKSDVSMKLVSQ